MIKRPSLVYRIGAAALLLYAVGGAAAFQCAAAPGAPAGLNSLPQLWRDDSGRDLSLADLAGSPVVLTMAYANCHRVCPTTIARLKRLQESLDVAGSSAEFVVVGYDPRNEGPATWRQYRKSHHLQRVNWHFVTGSVEEVAETARRLHFENWKYDEHVIHDSRVLIFDQRGALTRELRDDADLPGTAGP